MSRLQNATKEEKTVFLGKIEAKLDSMSQKQLKTQEGRLLKNMFDKVLQAV